MVFSSFPHALQRLIKNASINPSKQSPKHSYYILLEKIDKIDDDLKHIKDKLDKK